jgi:anthranilate synthase/aminodeoxychorismate synthase-like glutamine amidotransferase
LHILLDNYDSFTYNLQDYFAQLQLDCIVIRNDEKTADQIEALQPASLIFSPGPETPSKAGVMMELIHRFHSRIPLLGICLGHQGIGEYFGASLVRAARIMHGRTSPVFHTGHFLFQNVPSPFDAMRYHSLLLSETATTSLQVIAATAEGEPMAIIHPRYKICGFQFHPESILTPYGFTLLKNWLEWIGQS